MPDHKPGIYLSYDFDDADIIRYMLIPRLEEAFTVQTSSESVRAADSLPGSVSQQIDASSAVVVFVSKLTGSSQWVEWEVEAAKASGKRVLAFVTQNADLPAFLPGETESIAPAQLGGTERAIDALIASIRPASNPHNLYVTSLERGSGRTSLIVGLLASVDPYRGGGYFKPFSMDRWAALRDVAFIREHFGLMPGLDDLAPVRARRFLPPAESETYLDQMKAAFSKVRKASPAPLLLEGDFEPAFHIELKDMLDLFDAKLVVIVTPNIAPYINIWDAVRRVQSAGIEQMSFIINKSDGTVPDEVEGLISAVNGNLLGHIPFMPRLAAASIDEIAAWVGQKNPDAYIDTLVGDEGDTLIHEMLIGAFNDPAGWVRENPKPYPRAMATGGDRSAAIQSLADTELEAIYLTGFKRGTELPEFVTRYAAEKGKVLVGTDLDTKSLVNTADEAISGPFSDAAKVPVMVEGLADLNLADLAGVVARE